MDEGSSVFETKLNQYKIPLLLTLVGIVLLVGGLFSSGLIQKTFIKSTTAAPKIEPQNLTHTLKVDVSGSVKNPGVYSLNSDSRIEDGIKAAGGLSVGADLEFIQKNINLAQKLSDGTKIFIPQKGDEGTQVLGIAQTSSQSSGGNKIINITLASLEELDSLPGVGKVGAQKIIDNRPYSSIEELVTKKAVTKTVFEKIKDQISTY